MEIEKQRGISVTSSVMQFQYDGYCINILDTPGHQDFSEDTYRTLMAADSAVMVIDAGKGVEAQTRKLFKVCTMRHIPIFTFINKMDREARDPYELLEEIENELGIGTYPMNWPVGCGHDFKGVYDREKHRLITFDANNGQHEVAAHESRVDDDSLLPQLGENLLNTLRDDVELLDGAGMNSTYSCTRRKAVAGVLWFGPDQLRCRAVLGIVLAADHIPPAPSVRRHGGGPVRSRLFGFCVKIQANMNKVHRDRIAFMRICSGKFEKGMEVLHVQGGRKMKLSQPQQMMAQNREIIEEAYAGDIIGVFDPGVFSIGDTVCSPGMKVKFDGIPTFAPEFFCRVEQKDTMKRKQFVKGTSQIAQEGAIQVFREVGGGMEEVIVGVVGTLQFDVFRYRLENEYNVEVRMENLPYSYIR